jgi:hypothetical protein
VPEAGAGATPGAGACAGGRLDMATDSSKTKTATAAMGDWFDDAVRANVGREQETRLAGMSSDWGREWNGDVVRRLVEMREMARNIARIQGVPPACRVELAVTGQEGAACAGFEDAPESFERPFILLDKTVPESCDPSDVRDVVCGLVLHEAGHILHTREGFKRLYGGLSRVRRMFENLWEDERIEELVRQDSPGFAPFFQACKRALLERGEPGRALAVWDKCPDLDKANLLIFLFVRLPHLIDERLRGWRAINGEVVFETLRSMFPRGPRDEADVADFAARLEALHQRLRELYPGAPPRGEEGADRERLTRQATADAEDRALGKADSTAQNAAKSTGSPVVKRLLAEAAKLEAAGVDGAERLLERAVRADAGEDPLADRVGRRFGLHDLERLIERRATVSRPLDRTETAELERRERTRAADGDVWKWGCERRTTIVYPVATVAERAAYAAELSTVVAHKAAMRAALSLKLGEQLRHERERALGRIDRRRLALGAVTDRLYMRTRHEPGRTLGLCLLLDESGSMQGGEPARAVAARQAAVLSVEALRGLPGTELEVYAHTSYGNNHEHCLIRYLYGRKNPSPHSLGGYGPKGNNYDHQAILTCADMFEQNTTARERVMIVLSDGYPRGHRYTGFRALKATKEAVVKVRRRGIRVIGVAIGAYAAEEIFGSPYVLKFTDLHRLVADMRALFTRIVRGPSGLT